MRGDGKAMGGESKAIEGELSADQMKFDRNGKKSRRFLISGSLFHQYVETL